jgi:hypothetical protein
MQGQLSRSVVAVSIAISTIIMVVQPSFAGSRNEKIANITQRDLNSYCRNKFKMTYGRVIATDWGERYFSCIGRVKQTYRAQASFDRARSGGLDIGAKIQKLGIAANVNGEATEGVNGSVVWIVQYENTGVSLTNYCRDLKSYGRGHIFNPVNDHGRIFVAEGGRACHQTIVD